MKTTLFWEVPAIVHGVSITSSGSTTVEGGPPEAKAHWDKYFAPHGYRLTQSAAEQNADGANKPAKPSAPAGPVALELVNNDCGVDDYDVIGHATVHRVCIGHGIKKGDIFNAYGPPGVKQGGVWLGDLEKSLRKHLNVTGVRVAEPVTDCEPEAPRQRPSAS